MNYIRFHFGHTCCSASYFRCYPKFFVIQLRDWLNFGYGSYYVEMEFKK